MSIVVVRILGIEAEIVDVGQVSNPLGGVDITLSLLSEAERSELRQLHGARLTETHLVPGNSSQNIRICRVYAIEPCSIFPEISVECFCNAKNRKLRFDWVISHLIKVLDMMCFLFSPQVERVRCIVVDIPAVEARYHPGVLLEVLQTAPGSEPFRITRNLRHSDPPLSARGVLTEVHRQLDASRVSHIDVH